MTTALPLQVQCCLRQPALSAEIAVHLFSISCKNNLRELNRFSMDMHCDCTMTALPLHNIMLHQGVHTTTTRQERDLGPLSDSSGAHLARYRSSRWPPGPLSDLARTHSARYRVSNPTYLSIVFCSEAIKMLENIDS